MIILVTGGCRSGKSSQAAQLASSIGGRKLFIATAPVTDEEMRQRIERHKEARGEKGWDVLEETLDLAGAIRNSGDYDVIVVDCLTLWINNLMLEAVEKGQDLDEAGIVERCELLGVASSQGDNTVIFVTNEVGAGIVPDNESARAFRDLAGRCNQKIAAMADRVIMMVSGLPLILKGQKL